MARVHFANLSPPESPMIESAVNNFSEHIDGEMLRIKPQFTITFAKSGSDLVGTVEITNVDSKAVSYKIKTTAPEKFRVRPSTGVLPPSASVTINVVLQQGQQINTINREKFLVMCIGVANDISSNPQELAELWKTISAKSGSVEQHRLKCALPVNFDESGMDSVFGSSGGNITSGTDHYGSVPSYGGGGMTPMGGDKQMAHLQQTIAHLNDTTHRLEAQVKRNHKLQWITCILFVLLSVAIVYILKVEIKSNASQYCSTIEGHH
uniref:MSP domain-containing protein n=1 Tax=Anopheles atroparvus TaxID=41427 RepID=A0AAG5D9E4_ANOAO